MSVALDETSMQRGKAARAVAARSSHAEWAQPPQRQDPVAILEAQAATRIQQLVPIRYGRMLVSPFTFFRGAAAIMAADLATTPISGLRAQLCGDAHLSNFGVFAAPDRALDLRPQRLRRDAPGAVGVGRQAARREPRRGRARPRLRAGARGRTSSAPACAHTGTRCASSPAMRTLDVWYARLDVEQLFARWREALEAAATAKPLDKALAKARTQGQPARLRQAHARRRRRSRGSSATRR